MQVPNFVAKRWHAACVESANGTDNTGAELGIVRIDTSGAVSFISRPLSTPFIVKTENYDPYDLPCKLRNQTHPTTQN